MNWDVYFLKIAKEVSEKSHCLSRKIGAVLVKDKAIISTGYNGPARGVKHCNARSTRFYNEINRFPKDENHSDEYILGECPRKAMGYKSGEGLHLCQAGHAERNALIQAGRNGVSTLDTTLYAACPLPCKSCNIEIINSGVKKIVCFTGDDYDIYGRILLNEAGMVIKQINEKEILL